MSARRLSCGGPDRVREGLTALVQASAADELMLVCDIFDPLFRLRRLDIAAAAFSQCDNELDGSSLSMPSKR